MAANVTAVDAADAPTYDRVTDRTLVIDESEWEGGTILTAVALMTPTVGDLRDQTIALREGLNAMLPGFRSWDEFHGIELAKGLSNDERARHLTRGTIPLENYQREFIYRHALAHLCTLPAAHVYTCHWTWKRVELAAKGDKHLTRIMRRLLEWVDEHGFPVSDVVCDRGHDKPYMTALREAQEQRGEAWNVQFVDSKADVLVQLADLTAYAAKQQCTAGQKGNQARLASWYAEHLDAAVFAPGGDGHGYRRFKSGDCVPK